MAGWCPTPSAPDTRWSKRRFFTEEYKSGILDEYEERGTGIGAHCPASQGGPALHEYLLLAPQEDGVDRGRRNLSVSDLAD